MSSHRDQLELVSNELLKRETLDAQAFYGLMGLPMPKTPMLAVPPKLDETPDQPLAEQPPIGG